MTNDLLTVLLLLAAAILMFAFNKPRVDAVALIMLVLLPFTGVLTMSEALAGFSNPNIVLIGAMFVIGEALARTGVARGSGSWNRRLGRPHQPRLSDIHFQPNGIRTSQSLYCGSGTGYRNEKQVG